MASERSWLSPYNYVQNNPILRVDPTGALDWIDNEDGTYTAEDGDSAWSLHEQTGISFEKANSIVQYLYGPNYLGSDGVEKSNLNPGDIVRVFGSQSKKLLLPSPTTIIDFTASDEEFFDQTLKIAKGFSLENKEAGGSVFEPRKYDVGDFLRNAKTRDGVLNYYFGDTDGYGYNKFKRTVMIDGNQIDITLNVVQNDKMTLTRSYFNSEVIIQGLQHSNGGFSKHISIDFRNRELRDYYLNIINGKKE